MQSVRLAIRILLAISLVGLTSLAAASDAGEFVKGKQASLVTLLKQAETDKTQKKIESVFDEMLDYDTLAEQSLGKHWAGLKPEERSEFQDILKKLVRNSYRKNLKKTLGYDVKFNGEKKQAPGILVQSVAKSRKDKRADPVQVDYLLHKVKGAWRVRDIVTDRASLVTNYRQQFNRIIKKDGFPALITRMKAKLSEA
ncbi:MAG: ABC transporter substrate-binding protein [Polyangiaceae bacterium]|nr:ABC transporter substrate-binding protein [Polyangiaceae bacterium]